MIKAKRVNDADYIGKTFNFFTVLEVEQPTGVKGIERHTVCKCICGQIRRLRFSELRNGRRQSCGCMKNHLISKNKSPRGGMGRHKLHGVYRLMVDRCHDSRSEFYYNYGGRGINVCQEWLNDRYSFIYWALENGWESGLQIDRIDNDSGYSPSNCRFVTPQVNSLNRRNTVRIKIQGILMTLPDLSKMHGIPYKTLHYRYSKGYSNENLIKPVGSIF